MKNTLKAIVIAMLVASSNLTFALGGKSENMVSDELDVQIIKAVDGMTKIQFQKLETEIVTIKIHDSFGELIYSEKSIDATTFSKKYDVTALPTGAYTYTVSNKVYTVKKTIDKE